MRALLGLMGALALVGCGDDTEETTGGDNQEPVYQYNTSGVYFSNAALGIEITELEELGKDVQYNADKTLDMEGEALVSIEGLGTRAVGVFMNFESAANGGRNTVFTFDLEDDTERVFHYEPADNAIVIGDADGGVFIFQNPDNTYDVVTSLFDEPEDAALFEHADNGYEAYQILKQYTEVTSTSPFSLALAYAVAQRLSPQARGMKTCEVPNCPDGDESELTARPLAFGVSAQGFNQTREPLRVCEMFRDVCDCLACEAVGRGDDCALCAPP